jgi:AbiTii
MSLVNELQESAGKDDVLAVLRKTKRLASKLDRQDILNWLTAELNGYPDGMTPPDYRKIGTTIAYKSNGKGVIDLPLITSSLTVEVTQAISIIVAWIAGLNVGNEVYYPIERDSEFDQSIRKAWPHGVGPWNIPPLCYFEHYNASQIRTIPDRIKDTVLDWALELERSGVTGEGLSFSASEKQIAHSVVFNIHNSTVEQITSSGTNQKAGA